MLPEFSVADLRDVLTQSVAGMCCSPRGFPLAAAAATKEKLSPLRTDFRRSVALRCPPIQQAKRHKAGTRNGNKAYIALSLSSFPAWTSRGGVLGPYSFPFGLFQNLFLHEADMRHCFPLSPWLPASWLVGGSMSVCYAWRSRRPPLWRGTAGGTSTRSSHAAPLLWWQRRCVGSANLISHPVGALLPQAQGRGDKTQQFVHVLIANPPAERDNTC